MLLRHSGDGSTKEPFLNPSIVRVRQVCKSAGSFQRSHHTHTSPRCVTLRLPEASDTRHDASVFEVAAQPRDVALRRGAEEIHIFAAKVRRQKVAYQESRFGRVHVSLGIRQRASSSDPPWAKRTKSLRRPSGRRPGGQPGHAGHTMRLTQTPQRVVTHRPARCRHCSCHSWGREPRASSGGRSSS